MHQVEGHVGRGVAQVGGVVRGDAADVRGRAVAPGAVGRTCPAGGVVDADGVARARAAPADRARSTTPWRRAYPRGQAVVRPLEGRPGHRRPVAARLGVAAVAEQRANAAAGGTALARRQQVGQRAGQGRRGVVAGRRRRRAPVEVLVGDPVARPTPTAPCAACRPRRTPPRGRSPQSPPSRSGKRWPPLRSALLIDGVEDGDPCRSRWRRCASAPGSDEVDVVVAPRSTTGPCPARTARRATPSAARSPSPAACEHLVRRDLAVGEGAVREVPQRPLPRDRLVDARRPRARRGRPGSRAWRWRRRRGGPRPPGRRGPAPRRRPRRSRTSSRAVSAGGSRWRAGRRGPAGRAAAGRTGRADGRRRPTPARGGRTRGPPPGVSRTINRSSSSSSSSSSAASASSSTSGSAAIAKASMTSRLVVLVPGQRHRADPELLGDRGLERAWSSSSAGARAGTSVSPRRSTASSSSSTRSASAATCAFSRATVVSADAVAGLQEERPLSGLADGAGHEALGRVVARRPAA